MTKEPIKPDEATAAIIGGREGGAYLDQIGKTDLAVLTDVEWGIFCGKIFLATCAEIKRRADDEIPFDTPASTKKAAIEQCGRRDGDDETWTSVPSLPGIQASSWGIILLPERKSVMPNGGERIYKTKPRYGTKTVPFKGSPYEYYGIVIWGKPYKVHRLICEAFHGSATFDRAVVMHLDDNPQNNRPDNLEWGTQKENLNAEGFIEKCRLRTGENSTYAIGKRKKMEASHDGH